MMSSTEYYPESFGPGRWQYYSSQDLDQAVRFKEQARLRVLAELARASLNDSILWNKSNNASSALKATLFAKKPVTQSYYVSNSQF